MDLTICPFSVFRCFIQLLLITCCIPVPLVQKQKQMLGVKTNSLESCFGGCIIHVWGGYLWYLGGRVSPTPSIVLSSPSVRQREGQKARPSYMRSEGSVCFLAAVELGVFEWEEGW